MKERALRNIVILIILVLGIGLVVVRFIQDSDNVFSATVTGRSMIPSFEPNDEVKIDTEYYKNYSPEIGDFVAFISPDKDELTIKRIQGIEGDVMTIKERAIIRGDVLIVEGDIGVKNYFELDRQYRIPKNQVFLLGDNVSNSTDSRDFGFISVDQLIGRVISNIR
jgi:signal peptidase I